jgi:hypothetical protein
VRWRTLDLLVDQGRARDERSVSGVAAWPRVASRLYSSDGARISLLQGSQSLAPRDVGPLPGRSLVSKVDGRLKSMISLRPARRSPDIVVMSLPMRTPSGAVRGRMGTSGVDPHAPGQWRSDRGILIVYREIQKAALWRLLWA